MLTGYIPDEHALDTSGLSLSDKDFYSLFAIDNEAWGKEADDLEKYFSLFEDALPEGISKELTALKTRLES